MKTLLHQAGGTLSHFLVSGNDGFLLRFTGSVWSISLGRAVSAYRPDRPDNKAATCWPRWPMEYDFTPYRVSSLRIVISRFITAWLPLHTHTHTYLIIESQTMTLVTRVSLNVSCVCVWGEGIWFKNTSGLKWLKALRVVKLKSNNESVCASALAYCISCSQAASNWCRVITNQKQGPAFVFVPVWFRVSIWTLFK